MNASLTQPGLVFSASDIRSRLRRVRESIYDADVILTEANESRKPLSAGLHRTRGEAVRRIVAAEGCATCVETGFAYGMSSSVILEALLEHADNAAGGSPILTSIDPWQSSGFGNAGRRHLREAGAERLHTLMEEKSELALPALVRAKRRFDVAFIDGDHRFDGVFIDVFYALRLVGPGGLMILDDVWMPAVQSCVNFFTANGVCSLERRPEIAESQHFFLLRVADNDTRAWDHFTEFQVASPSRGAKSPARSGA